MLDPCDALRGGLEPAHELRMSDEPRTEDAQHDLASHGRLVGPMDLTELADADDRAELVAGYRALQRAGDRGWQSVDQELRELRVEPIADELVDAKSGVETDDVVASERLGGPA